MNQLSIFDQPVYITTHKREYTKEGEVHVATHQIHFTGQCLKLLRYWQQPNQNHWLSCSDITRITGSTYPPIRISDLRKAGVPIDDKWDETVTPKIKRYKLRCKCRMGGTDQSECYLHSNNLKA